VARVATICVLAVLLTAASAAAKPGASGRDVEYPRFNEKYEIVDFRGLGRHYSVVTENDRFVMDGTWTVRFSYKGGTLRLKNPTRSRRTPNGRIEPTSVPPLKLRAQTYDWSSGSQALGQECREERPASLPKAFIYYGPNAIQRKVRRVPTNRLEIHWVLPTFPEVSCGGMTVRQPPPPTVPRSGREIFTLTYTYERFKQPGAVTPFEFRFPYDNGDGTRGVVSWRGRIIVKRKR
jgi:hypothetical protein